MARHKLFESGKMNNAEERERERSCSAGNYVVLTDSSRSNGKETPTGGCADVARSSYTARISVISIFRILIIY